MPGNGSKFLPFNFNTLSVRVSQKVVLYFTSIVRKKLIAFIGNDAESNVLSSEDKLGFQYFQKLVCFDQILNHYNTAKILDDLYNVLQYFCLKTSFNIHRFTRICFVKTRLTFFRKNCQQTANEPL